MPRKIMDLMYDIRVWDSYRIIVEFNRDTSQFDWYAYERRFGIFWRQLGTGIESTPGKAYDEAHSRVSLQIKSKLT